jgi:hypothetical protein
MPDDADIVAAFAPLAAAVATSQSLPLRQMLQTIDGRTEQRRLEWSHFPAPVVQFGMSDPDSYQLRGFLQIAVVGPVAEGVGWFYQTAQAVTDAFPLGTGIGPALVSGRPSCLPITTIPQTRSAVLAVTIPYHAT